MNDNGLPPTPNDLDLKAFGLFLEFEPESKNDDEDLQLFLNHFKNELRQYKAYIEANNCDERTAFLNVIWKSWELQKANGNGNASTPEFIEAVPLPELPDEAYAKEQLKKTLGIPLPTDEDANYHYNQPSNVPPLSPAPDPAGQTGFFIVKSANDTIKEAAERPDPVPLYRTLWFEGEACCLYADANIGKSILAVQIATAIAQKQLVILFDFELSDKMFQIRYTDKETKQLYNFPQNLFRLEINPDNLDFNSDFEDALIKNIEQTAISMEAKVIIVDNLTWLCNESEKGDAAGQLMKALHGFTRKYGWSILVIAHTPKRSMDNPITQNDLAGSKKLINFFDSAFAIGRSAKDENLVYIKQIKVRNDVFRYASENVIVCTIEKIGAFLHFKQIGFASESEHLKKKESKEEKELQDTVVSLRMEGKSQQAIADELGKSKATICRILKKVEFN